MWVKVLRFWPEPAARFYARFFFACDFLLVFAVCFCAGIRVHLRWHPRFVSVLHASPLCGAAPTFLCRRKEK
ncbi:hypothetical protein PCAR4_1200040 [Paraburkholderia caribensis]|nr:hypothetical protein PCAR4_1200040 [Paraburkholderia caribensis]